jgi:hypothetical protein
MTLKQWLAEERQPQMCGINARQHLKNMVGISGHAIHARVNINAVSATIRRLVATLERA